LENIHRELLYQFKVVGFSIESGMAVDARLIRSASRPVSGKKLEGLREKRESESDTCQGMRGGVVRPRTEKGKKIQIVPYWERLDGV